MRSGLNSGDDAPIYEPAVKKIYLRYNSVVVSGRITRGFAVRHGGNALQLAPRIGTVSASIRWDHRPWPRTTLTD